MAIAIIILLEVFSRLTPYQSVNGLFEIISVLLCVTVFASIPFITLDRSHISINAIDHILPKKCIRVLNIIASALGSIVFFIISIALWNDGVRAIEWNTVTNVLEIPVGPLILLLSLSTAVTTLVYVSQLLR